MCHLKQCCRHHVPNLPDLQMRLKVCRFGNYLVLLVGASSSFLTPMSYQTNLMVFTPGKYRFSDYAKFGFGLQLMMVGLSIGMAFVAGGMYKD